MQTTFVAPDIECAGCAAGIQRALGQEAGVTEVIVEVPAKTVTVEYDSAKTNPDILAATLADIGFSPQN